MTLSVLPDPIPGTMNCSLPEAKAGAADLLLTWLDRPDPSDAYRAVSLDCDTDLDGACDQDPRAFAVLAHAGGARRRIGTVARGTAVRGFVPGVGETTHNSSACREFRPLGAAGPPSAWRAGRPAFVALR